MASWKFWEWVAYACLFVAAVIVATDAGIKNAPTLSPHLPDWIGGEYWSFAPLSLIIISGLIFLGKAIRVQLPGAGVRNTEVAPPAEVASRIVAQTDPPEPPTSKRILVPQDAYYLHDTAAEGYPHKLKIVLRNDSAGDVIVTSAEWQDTWNLTLPPLNEHLWQSEGPHGWQNDDWRGETQEALVRPGRAIQTWVGLPSPLDEIELRRRIMTKRLGTLIVPLTIDGRTTLKTIRL